MNISVISFIIVVSIITFLPVNIIYFIMDKILERIFHNGKQTLEYIIMSFSSILIYTFIYFVSVEAVNNKQPLNNFEAYVSFVIYGIIVVLWCYLRWDKLKVEFNYDKKLLAIKRAIMFFFIMIFTLYKGYGDAMNNRNYILDVINIAVITAIIAFDRVLNQVWIIREKIKEERQSDKKTSSLPDTADHAD